MNEDFVKSLRDLNVDYKSASYQYSLLIEEINEFQSNLNNEEEIVLLMASFGQTIKLYITDIGYANPSLIYFYGFIEGKGTESTLIQHISQLNFLITSAKRLDETKPARRLGFTS
ncbi:hypothetical protein A0U40_13500 [[Bacillus] sp. KCTC 13219]|nr:hypothetical protein A0U40_13500 [[Bacillus] sp. KCTC 13219]